MRIQLNKNLARGVAALGLLATVLVAPPTSPASAGERSAPTFSKLFQLDVIGPGSTSTLTFTITNGSTKGADELAFTDNLPASITISDAPAVSNSCSGDLTAPPGGGTITLADGQVGASSSCEISVNVTSSTDGVHTNTTGDLTSSLGNSGTATDDLEVDDSLPGFVKFFDPSTVAFGEVTTLKFRIDNVLGGNRYNMLFTDTLPAGVTVANPSNVVNTCGGTVTATSGDDEISLSGGTVSGGEICTIDVDVVAGAVGTLENVSSDLSSLNAGFTTDLSGKAAAALDVAAIGDTLEILKEFVDDPLAPGGTGILEFTITNRNRDFAADDIAFSDDLDATLTGLTTTGAVENTCGGMATSVFPTGLFEYAGGSLAAEASCTVAITVLVPGDADNGAFPNETSNVTGTVDGSPEVGNRAGDLLYVTSFPLLTKEFTTDPVGSGGTATIEFTITNPETDSTMSDITFTDVFDEILPTAASVPADGFCGPGSTATFTPLVDGFGSTPASLTISTASLTAPPDVDSTCTFSIELDVAEDAAGGGYPNETSEIDGTLDDLGNAAVTGPAASDTLAVIAAPQVSKEFTDDPVLPGGTVTLTFTLENLDPDNAASDIAFTDGLGALNLDGDNNPATAGGLVATSVDVNDCGATVDIATDPSIIDVSDGSLAPGASCTITVTLSVPATAGGTFENTTSVPTATVAGITASAAPATDDLVVTGLTIDKEFVDDPAIAGGTVDLVFTIDNQSGSDATNITFEDALELGLTAQLPPDPDPPCGVGSVMTTFNPPGPPTSGVLLTGGNLLAGENCVFTVTLDVDAGMADGQYANATYDEFATIGATPFVPLASASDVLTVDTTLIGLAKEFTDDPAAPGGTVELVFTVENLSAIDTITAIAFDDDLDATLSGLTVGSVDGDTCGGTPAGVGTGTFSYTGGTLAATATCTITLTLDVPAGPFAGNTFPNTTTTPSGTVGGLAVSGNQATDTLLVDTVEFSKSFDGPTTATGTAALEFTITNLDSASGVSAVSFFDNLGNVLPGLFASGLPAAPCGAGSSLSGSSILTLTGGVLPPSGSCSFSVTVNVPAGTEDGDYPNTTSQLTSAGLRLADPATADLTIEPPPTFTKAFAPSPIVEGDTSTLTFTIDNTTSALTASNLAFTDNLPAGVVVETPAGAATTCTGGTLTANPGGTTISFSGGTVDAGTTCTITVDVTSVVAGDHLNTSGDLTSTSGNSGPASDTLTVTAIPPLFSKAFAPSPIVEGDVSTLTFTIDNTASANAATNLDFTDNLPAGVVIATPSNKAKTCTGGMVGAPDGGTTISYGGGEVDAGATCTITVDVTSVVAGDHINTTGDLTSSSGNSGTATDTLTVTAIAPTFTKTFAPNPIVEGDTSTLTFTIDNTASANDATNLTFTDTFPTGVEIATPLTKTNTCTGGMSSDAAGDNSFSFSGGTVDAGTTCTITVNVTSSTAGDHINTTGNLTSSSGNSGTATDTLTVTAIAPTFTKTFAPNPIVEGDTSTLTFTIDNTASANDATNLTFTDTFPTGVEIATPLTKTNTCTGGMSSDAAGDNSFSFSGGTVDAGTTCTITVNVTSSTAGDHINTTGNLTSSSGNSGTATDTLTVTAIAPTFTKTFAPNPIVEGDTSTLTFTIDNTASANDATNLTFTDTFPTGVEIATPLTKTNTCTGGMSSDAAGDNSFSFSGGTVDAGTTCTITVNVTSSTAGDHINTTGNLTSSSGNSGTATDTLTVTAIAPTFTKTFAPNPIVEGDTSTLTFTIDNTASANDATNLTFTDNLPAGVEIATPLTKTNTCTGGMSSDAAGDNSFSFSGGTVDAGTTCTITVNVTSSTAGDHINTTGNLTSSSGNSGTATDTLTVTAIAPTFTKTFAPNPIVEGDTSTLTFTIDNTASANDATNLTFTDTFPTGVEIATPLTKTNTCTGGMSSDAAGDNSFSFSGGTVDAGTTCTITVNVTSSTAGDHINTTGNLTSSSGNSGTATDTLTVTARSAPTVTINQAVGQADPTNAAPINFTVVFSEPVTGFDAADVNVVNGTVASVTAAGTNTYTVAVTPSAEGLITATVPAGGAVDNESTPNVASTSTDNSVNFDSTEPTFNTQTITVNNDPGKAGAVVDYMVSTTDEGTTTGNFTARLATVDEIVQPSNFTCTPSSGSFFPIGTTRVTCTATDDAGNTSTGSFDVIVVDNEKPVISPAPNITRTAQTGNSVAVTFPTPAATDNSGTVSVVCAPASGSTFNVGTTTVTCTATDPANNTASTTFTVTVEAAAALPATGGSLGGLTLALQLLLAGLGLFAVSRFRRRNRTAHS